MTTRRNRRELMIDAIPGVTSAIPAAWVVTSSTGSVLLGLLTGLGGGVILGALAVAIAPFARRFVTPPPSTDR